LCWIGENPDLANLMTILQEDPSEEVRAFCASAVLQLYLRDLTIQKKKQDLLYALLKTLKQETAPALLNSILIAI